MAASAACGQCLQPQALLFLKCGAQAATAAAAAVVCKEAAQAQADTQLKPVQ